MTDNIEVLISSAAIKKRVEEIGRQISDDYFGKQITLICVLKGGVIFMVDLARNIEVPVELDFLEVSSYDNATESSGIIKINKDLKNPITGKDVLLVEDIIDSGRTLSMLVRHLQSQEPASLKVCTLLDKPDRRTVPDVEPEYVGFVIPDEFVVGYGLDYAQKYRNLSYIGVLKFQETPDEK